MIGEEAPKRGEEREGGPHSINQWNFFFNKKPSHLRGECRHQFRVLGKFKRGVDVSHEYWLCVREGTLLSGECLLHPNAPTMGHYPTRGVLVSKGVL
ncbi:hypothetical protein Hanom_Chr11g01043361 [Helianthus anomalus]